MQKVIKKVFIHTNNKQFLGAVLAKYAIERKLPKDSDIKVEFINVDEIEAFKDFAGKEYLFAGNTRVYNPKDLQSFTLSRFMPPELMNYSGLAAVIDPDIFAIRDISPLFEMDMTGRSIAACAKKDTWDTSVMLMKCEELKHWKIKDILKGLADKKLDYVFDVMSLKHEPRNSILELSRKWNNLDTLTPDTYMVHMTNRMTQPWKTGLPIDFTINPLPKYFGIIPREPIHKLLGKYPTHYKKHPDKNIEDYFLSLVRDALREKVISSELIQEEISKGHVRKDLASIS